MVFLFVYPRVQIIPGQVWQRVFSRATYRVIIVEAVGFFFPTAWGWCVSFFRLFFTVCSHLFSLSAGCQGWFVGMKNKRQQIQKDENVIDNKSVHELARIWGILYK